MPNRIFVASTRPGTERNVRNVSKFNLLALPQLAQAMLNRTFRLPQNDAKLTSAGMPVINPTIRFFDPDSRSFAGMKRLPFS
ncbi:hypothetical protein RvY_16277 [Ramazzottius varieornatus]|uniref:Uncharacterized protein n=1 Tax=Ramazzottius varieornatus TaxID=947166 RepID=A0A1D1W2B8_RAMVA|nr:hypothetical protein RvY_16277 [Ramazzottius varieornatus]